MTDSQIALPPENKVGVVGSQSSTSTLVVDLVGTAKARSVVGRMVMIHPADADGDHEYGIGTVTEVVNRNRFHEDPALRGVISVRGGIGGLTANADIMTAEVAMTAAFRERQGQIRPVGGGTTFAPHTGEPVYLASNEVVQAIARGATRDLFYLGSLYRQPDVLLPMSVRDFSGSRGGSMAGFFGPSGSGKSAAGTLYVASQMRHTQMGFLLIDPQGQFTTSSKVGRELPLDLRALADAQGRAVVQLSVAREVRLPDDPDMFTQMLGHAKFFHSRTMVGAVNQAPAVGELVNDWLSRDEQKRWSDTDAEPLLEALVEFLMNQAQVGNVFSTIARPENPDDDLPVDDTKPGNRFFHNMRSVLFPDEYDATERDGRQRKERMLRAFAPLLNLFSAHGPEGRGDRVGIKEIVRAVTNTDMGSAGKKKPRPFFVLTLADRIVGERGEETALTNALTSEETQGLILRTLFAALERSAQWHYQEGHSPANVMVVLDEAARFVSKKSRNDQARDLSEELARYFRELRKYAVGFTLFLQEPASMNESIWKQLRNGFQVFAGGLVGSDLDRVREQVGDKGALRLYSQLAQPSADNPVYPFMVCGSISPLSATSSPLFLEVFSGHSVADAGAAWARANREWLKPSTAGFDPTTVWHGHNSLADL